MRVLVTADSGASRRVLTEVLESLGHVVLDTAELGAGALLAGTNWNADVAVAGLFASRPTMNQRSAFLVEVGIALGKSIPVLVLAKNGVGTPALSDLPLIQADLVDVETLRLKLDLFLQGILAGVPTRSRVGGLTPGKPKPSPTPSVRGPELERTVATLLASSGSQLIAEPGANAPARTDLAIYLEGPESAFGVILVEVKQLAGRDAPRRLREAATRLERLVTQTKAGLGIVVYDGADVSELRVSQPLVATISLTRLRLELEERSLSDLVRRLRNESIHGR